MPTLAPKLPWQHAFAGGYPGRSGQYLPVDADAIDYLSRLAAADGAAVEVGIAQAIEAFIVGCKADNAGYAGDPTRSNWDAIKASCIMCGARTLSGALVPLKTPYGPEKFNPSASPSIVGATGSYNVSTRTMTNSASAEYPSYPRFNFNYSLTQNKRYRIDGVLSGDIDAVYGVYLGGTVLSDSRANGVLTFSGIYTATDVTTLFGLWFRGQQYFPASFRIEFLSIREDSFTPTPYNFASGDYSRSGTPGLKGDGSTKYLDTNRAGNADGQDDFHAACFALFNDNATKILFGARTPGTNIGGVEMRHSATNFCRPVADVSDTSVTPTVSVQQLIGCSRNSSSQYKTRISGVTTTIANNSGTPVSHNIHIFTRNDFAAKSDARIAFYSVGAAIDLAAMDERVTNLVTAVRFHTLTGLLPNDYDPATIAYIVSGISAGGTL